MTEKQAPYMDHLVINEPANITGIAPQTAMFSFEADGADRQALRKYVVRTVNGIVGCSVAGFPDYTIRCVVQFQVSEPWQYHMLQKWHCDVYVLCEIAPKPTSLNQQLTAAWMRADAELEALGDESPDVVAGAGDQVMSVEEGWF